MSSIRVMPANHPDLGARLKRLSDPPKQLFINGQYDPSWPSVAIVGSRKHSSYGLQVAQALAGNLARAGLCIVSGLALGIDSLAHAAALKAGGKTLAVMPGGVDIVYPASHRQLAADILAGGGALVSEYPAGTLAAKHHFVARNRIVAALSDAVLVVEAAAKSGTLITAEFALDMGIPVMAVPGPITSPNSVGTNRLIDTGAKLVASTQDVLDELGIVETKPSGTYRASNPISQSIVDQLSAGPVPGGLLMKQLALDTAVLNRELTHLELDGAVVNLGNNIWALRSDLHRVG